MTTATPLTIVDNEGLIHWFLNRRQVSRWLRGAGLDHADLLQAGRFGLMKAIERFDPNRGVAFSTFALHWVRQAVQREVECHDVAIRVPVHVQAKRRAAGVAMRRGERRLNAPVRGTRHDEGEGAELMDLLPSNAPLPDAGLEESDRAALLERLMSEAGLSRRERIVLRERFGARESTLDDVRSLVGGVSRERVRQLERDALVKLRDAARRLGLSADCAV